MTLAERIRALRIEQHMTLDEVGKAIGVGRATVYKYEHGIISNIPSDKILALAKLFDVSRPYLMGWSEDRHMTMSDVSILADNNMFLKAYGAMTQEERELLSDILIAAYARSKD